jgi:polysaccharide biosynthesis transport protein
MLVPSSSLPADSAPATRWEPDFRYYLAALVRRVWLIAGIVLAVTTSATLYALRLPNIYESSAVLRLQLAGSSLPGGQAAASSFEAYQYFQTQIELLKDPHLIRRAVLKHRLYLDTRLLGGNGRDDWFAPFRKLAGDGKPLLPSTTPEVSPGDFAGAPEDLTPEQTATLEPYVSSIQQGLAVSPKENTNLITVSFRHTNPECAALVPAAVTETFISENGKFENAGMRSALERGGRQIAEIQTTIQQLEQQRIEFLRKNNLPLSEGHGRNLTGERVGLLSAQLLAAEDERKRLEADCEAAEAAADIWSVPQVAASRAVQEGRAHLRELEKRRQVLLQTYTEQWPEVKKLGAELKQSEAEVETAAREAVGSLKATYAAALARERKLRSAYERENDAANDQSRNSVELTNVNQKIETSRQLYTTLLQYQKRLELDSTDRGNSVSLVSPAIRPQSPVAPPRWTKVLLAFFISLAAGIALALLIEQFNSKLSSVDEVATHLSLQTLGVIPLHQRKSLMGVVRRRGESGDSALRMMEDALSPTAEAYRNLRTSLLFATQAAEPQVILITSGQQLEGKTTTSVNLAYAFAQAGAEVLLLDCDLRRPTVHNHFGLSNSPGLTDCLTGDADIEALLFSHRDYPSLKVLAAGAMPANPSDYLNSAVMRDLLERVRGRFDYIVIDSPPAIPFADAPLLSTMADATLIVINSRRTNRRTVSRVRDRLLQLGSQVSGVVLNYVQSEANDSYYYYKKDERLPARGDGEAS